MGGHFEFAETIKFAQERRNAQTTKLPNTLTSRFALAEERKRFRRSSTCEESLTPLY
jgi:hypothetical protein